ncbi:MAG TPA: DNA mismatch repair protein MutS [Methanocorpusculum sp.]|nr:DNA mismatch repair protein MutS [Methanocorpusculum sp.]HJJ32933.1 DNA mismatch repair protein MutS [Methanocorpusculum sp.]HJJ44251.1 DNA mismatch repair protein MutS [Methanocorpusculum sp.]
MPPKKETASLSTATKLTPAMQQVKAFKEQYPDCILFMRMGDFYETFFEDAEICSRELDLVLTSRSKDLEGRPVPLAGIPYHAVDLYLPRMIRKGYKVAVCEQTEDPKLAKGVVKRDVTRVVTPGTVIDADIIPGAAAHYLLSMAYDAKKKTAGLAFLDVSTGEFFVEDADTAAGFDAVSAEIERYNPLEILIPSDISADAVSYLAGLLRVITPVSRAKFENGAEVLCEQFGVASLEGFDTSSELCISAAAAAVRYVSETQKASLTHIRGFSKKYSSDAMILDAAALRNLEILTPLRGDRNDTTLFGFLNRTKTPMGARALREAVTRPMTSPDKINRSLDAVQHFTEHPVLLSDVRGILSHLSDIERIGGRIAFGNARPQDLLALSSSLRELPALISAVSGASGILKEAADAIPPFEGTADLIDSAIADEPPAVYKNGNVIRAGYSADLDTLRDVIANGRSWIADLQNTEREKTGIRSLKIAYNNVLGYYIEVTKSNLDKVPAEYERKQTTANGERFTIPALREREALMAQADERTIALEIQLYESLIETLWGFVPEFQQAASAIGIIDRAASFADLALTNGYVRPELVLEPELLIRDGRHPIVENAVPGGYVPNDTEMSVDDKQILILTGANMAGKSTYMRMVALICIMAQTGCFVPARFARIGIVDRVFTRVGASDDLAGGRSTFMVEMLELAGILNNATERSLILLDEIGRGTSTVDGYAIARAVLEYLHGKGGMGPRTLFATHFHQLISMESELKRIKNYHFAVKEDSHDITFLRKLIPGATDRSYGIHVAKIAGVPKKVLVRAEEILKAALREDAASGGQKYYTQMLLVSEPAQESAPSAVETRLREVNPDTMTPMQALMFISELKSLQEKNHEQDSCPR